MLLFGHVVAIALDGSTYGDEISVVYGDEAEADRAMYQFSSRTPMPLCFKYARIALCDLSPMLFPVAVCLLVFDPAPPLVPLAGRMAPTDRCACKG